MRWRKEGLERGRARENLLRGMLWVLVKSSAVKLARGTGDD